jgi:hypothetical protein
VPNLMVLSKIFCSFDWLNSRREDEGDSKLSEDSKAALYGLNRLEDPIPVPGDPSNDVVDIIFVHGLGGSARKTWTHAQSKQCWPLWLYRHKHIDNIRLFTFGYDATWEKIWAPRNSLGIKDFAHQLLDCLNLHYAFSGNVYSCPSKHF